LVVPKQIGEHLSREVGRGLDGHIGVAGERQVKLNAAHTEDADGKRVTAHGGSPYRAAEGLVQNEDEREGEIGQMVNSVRRAAIRKDPTIVALFEETIRYHGQVAVRAHKTRLKNEEPVQTETPAPTADSPA
jgi:hypothetical protein